jgi:hypothetical protein
MLRELASRGWPVNLWSADAVPGPLAYPASPVTLGPRYQKSSADNQEPVPLARATRLRSGVGGVPEIFGRQAETRETRFRAHLSGFKVGGAQGGAVRRPALSGWT